MHHPHSVFDKAFLEQIAAQLSKQRDELNRLRRAVKAASPRPDGEVKSMDYGRKGLPFRALLSSSPRHTKQRQ